MLCLACLFTIHNATRPMMPSTATPPMTEPAIKPALGPPPLSSDGTTVCEGVGIPKGLAVDDVDTPTGALLIPADVVVIVTTTVDEATSGM